MTRADLTARLEWLAERMERQPAAAEASSARFVAGLPNTDRDRLAFRAGCLEGALRDYASDVRALITRIKENSK